MPEAHSSAQGGGVGGGMEITSAIKINNKVRRVQRERGQKSLFKYLGNYYFNYYENVFY